MIKLVVSDMDGTCLNRKSEISEYTKNILIQMQRQGVKLVLASGRTSNTLIPYSKQLDMAQYGGHLICANGVSVVDCTSEIEEINRQLNHEELVELFEFFMSQDTEIMAQQNYILHYHIPESLMACKREYRKLHQIEQDVPWTGGVHAPIRDHRTNYPTMIEINDSSKLPMQANKMVVWNEPERLEEIVQACKSKFNDRFCFHRTTPLWLECMPQGITKGNAIAVLQKQLGISPEETLVFGDGENDASMFAYGHAVAMQNSMDSVKELADEIGGHHNEDGVAKYIEKYVINQ